ncbi:hypothetical protein F4778DRAFT_700742 [Xylariomycetidae sp. FL2044]|nr:hypothetical protein F4778DRAFT_700742 [Xylariomycetidae sp. FL2044]
MSRRPGGPSGGAGLAQQNRQNEYFVPRDGIDREVITADICRYLGNDALVRPGNYENPQSGQVIQGYFINAYRNLTSAMIEDLKADSARWDQERRMQSATSRNTAGGTIAPNGVYARMSNSPVGQYRQSETHHMRHTYGPTDGSSLDPNRDQYGDATPRYPGTGSAGYKGAAGSSYSSQPYQTSYAPQGSGYTTSASPQFASPSDNMSYPSGHTVASGFAPSAPAGSILMTDQGFKARDPSSSWNDPYATASSRDPRDARADPRDLRMPVSTMPSTRTTYATSGAPAPAGYTTTSSTANYYTSNQSPSGNTYSVQPVDSFYGRASPAGATHYSSASVDPQYGNAPVSSRNTTSASSAQLPSSGSSSSRHRDRDSVDRDRHSDSRHGHRSHRSGR